MNQIDTQHNNDLMVQILEKLYLQIVNALINLLEYLELRLAPYSFLTKLQHKDYQQVLVSL